MKAKRLQGSAHWLFLLGAPALFQTGAEAQAAELEELQVSALKRPQVLSRVPVSMTALSAEELSASGATSIAQVSRLVPSLEVQSSNSAVTTNFRIRRVGNLGNIPTFEPAVGLFVDGAYRSNPVFVSPELLDIDRVEILRGPQSTLYGKNTTAGVIALFTRTPGQNRELDLSLTGGVVDGAKNATLTRLRGTLYSPLGDSTVGSLGFSLASHGNTFDTGLQGAGENSNDLDHYALRGQLQAEITNRLSLRLLVNGLHEDDRQYSPDLYFDPDGFISNFIIPTWQAAGGAGQCDDNDPSDRTTCMLHANRSDVTARSATLLTDYALDNGWRLSAVTSWDWYKFRGEQRDAAQMWSPIAIFQDTQRSESWQQEIRLQSADGGPVEWLGGVFFYTNDFDRGDGGKRPLFLPDEFSADPVVATTNQLLLGTPFPLPMAAAGQSGHLDSSQDTDYLGVFGEATWAVSESFRLSAGMRWQDERKEADIAQWTSTPDPSVFSLLLSPASASGHGLHHDSTHLSWSLSPQWQVDDNTLAYATVARTYKAGGFNTGFGALPIARREFADEDVTHYELGFRAVSPDRRLQLSASVFATDYDDYQDAAWVGAQFTVGNAEKAELRGAELDGTWLLAERLLLNFGASYVDFSYAKNTHGQCYPGRAPDSPTDPTACDLGGERPVNAPPWRTYLGLGYERTLGGFDVFGRADWNWTDDYNTSFSADPHLRQGAYNWVNLRVGLHRGRTTATLWIENLLNKTVSNAEGVVNLYTGDGSYQNFLQSPRSAGITVEISI